MFHHHSYCLNDLVCSFVSEKRTLHFTYNSQIFEWKVFWSSLDHGKLWTEVWLSFYKLRRLSGYFAGNKHRSKVFQSGYGTCAWGSRWHFRNLHSSILRKSSSTCFSSQSTEIFSVNSCLEYLSCSKGLHFRKSNPQLICELKRLSSEGIHLRLFICQQSERHLTQYPSSNDPVLSFNNQFFFGSISGGLNSKRFNRRRCFGLKSPRSIILNTYKFRLERGILQTSDDELNSLNESWIMFLSRSAGMRLGISTQMEISFKIVQSLTWKAKRQYP